MRYSVYNQIASTTDLYTLVKRVGATDIQVMLASGVIFCNLTDGQVLELAKKGIEAQVVQSVSVHQIRVPTEPPPDITKAQMSGLDSLYLSRFLQLATSLDPPIDGSGIGFTIAVLDTGIRETHEGLRGKVVHTKNCTPTASATDVFNHGTGVAWLAVGGQRVENVPQGYAPGARLMNIKVLNDSGEGTTETVVAGMEEVARLYDAHPIKRATELTPSVVNLSAGGPDTGNPADPLRIACRALLVRGIAIIAAAGNSGPGAGTLLSPAVDELVFAIGAVDENFVAPDWSSRGPTKEGLVKPDIAFFGVNLLTASSEGDTAYRSASGTSFAAAEISGGTAVVAEYLYRVLGGIPFEKLPELLSQLPDYTVKAEQYSAGKDNIVGWGVPFGDIIQQQFGTLGTGLDIMAIVTPVLMLGLVSSVLKGFVRE